MTKPAATLASKTSKTPKTPKAPSHLETLAAILDGKRSLADVHQAANDTTAAGAPGRRRPVNPTDAIEGPIPPRSNVLPKTATGDEVDVHWIFNWADGKLEPAPFTSP